MEIGMFIQSINNLRNMFPVEPSECWSESPRIIKPDSCSFETMSGAATIV